MLQVQVGVNLRGSDTAVSEKHLYCSQVGTSFKEVSRKGMAQYMRIHTGFELAFFGIELQDLPQALSGQRLAPLPRKI